MAEPENSSSAEPEKEERLLRASLSCLELIGLIDSALLLLVKKRITLEERAITEYFIGCVEVYAEILASLHNSLPSPELKPSAKEALVRLSETNERFQTEVEALLKALRFNFNYVEQYFEYDFYTRLLEKCLFADQLRAIADTLKAGS